MLTESASTPVLKKNDTTPCARVVRRITVAGELPEGPGGFRSRPLEGELFNVLG